MTRIFDDKSLWPKDSLLDIINWGTFFSVKFIIAIWTYPLYDIWHYDQKARRNKYHFIYSFLISIGYEPFERWSPIGH